MSLCECCMSEMNSIFCSSMTIHGHNDHKLGAQCDVMI